MPIKIEILADSPLEFFQHLEALLRGGMSLPSVFEAIEEPHVVMAPPEAITPMATDLMAQMQKDINAAPAQPKKRIRNRSKIKPLPETPAAEDDDPLATGPEPEDEDEDFEDDAAETEPFDPPPVDEQLIAGATNKLRDLFKVNADGVKGVRALREKYQVTYFHQVPPEKAAELWADALKLEAELQA